MSVPRPLPSSIPDQPGAYMFRDRDGRPVYVGKAKSLRKRVTSYWSKPLHPRTEAMMQAAAQVEWIVAATEVDALMLEYNLIKSHRPRFNVRYRDDKSYPYLALTVGEKWPRARVMRGARQKGVRYFGPFGHAYAIRETLDALTRVFPVRTCSNSFFDQRARAKRPCLYYDIGRCSGPCVPEATGVTEEEYRLQVDALGDFLSGKYAPVLTRLKGDMQTAAEHQEYERAAKLRDQLNAARKAMEHQEMVLTREEDLDAIGSAEDDLEAAFQAFWIRRGRVMGRKGWVVDRVEDLDTGGLVSSFLQQLYMEREEVPPGISGPPGGRGAGGQAPARRDGPAERPGGLSATQAPAGERLRRPLQGAGGAGRRPRTGPGAPADRVLRHLKPRPDGQGRQHGRLRGRPAEAHRLPEVRDQGRPRTGRLRQHGGDARAPVHPLAGGPAGGAHRRRRRGPAPVPPVRLPARVDRGRRRARPAGGRREGPRRPRPGHPGRRPGQAAGGGVPPGAARPAADPPDLRGPVRAPAPPGRGAPVRHHVSPAEAGEARAGLATRRCAGRRTCAEEGVAPAVRLPHAAPSGIRGGDHADAGNRPGDGECHRGTPALARSGQANGMTQAPGKQDKDRALEDGARRTRPPGVQPAGGDGAAADSGAAPRGQEAPDAPRRPAASRTSDTSSSTTCRPR